MNRFKGILLIWGALILLPFIWLILIGVSGQWTYPHILPSELRLSHIGQILLSDSQLKPALLNSLLIGCLATSLTMLITIPTAKVFAFQQILPVRGLQVLIYLPLILPAVAVMTATQITFIQLRLTGTFLGIILVHVYFMLPYSLQIMMQMYRQIGTGYELSGKTLGATNWQIWRSITYPLIKPGLMSASSLVFIISMSQYLPTFFIGGGKIVTLPMILLPYAQSGRMQIASVYSLLFIAASLIGVSMINYVLSLSHDERSRKDGD